MSQIQPNNRRDSKAKNEKKSQIAALIEYTRNDTTNEYNEINFGIIPNHLAQKINQETGVRTNGAFKTLSNYAIDHIFKNHGAGTDQEKRGQKTITELDLELIPAILSSADNVSKGTTNSRGKQTLLFRKKINGVDYHLVMSISIRKNQQTHQEEAKLVVNTLYAKK
ncbi:hypothetical protein [Chitinophaga caseinilytica]|uniref:PBECR3 domain-containing polyvalent protein n=1 Tax=Chitinophaga caseinilytica TaxID=2267521 RepID=UPI003C2C6781